MEKKTGGCHCQKVRYEVDIDLTQPVIECNCSLCQKKAAIMTFVPASSFRLVEASAPDEIYHLAAQAHVGRSFDLPHATALATGIGALNMLEAMRKHTPRARFLQASSAELYGNTTIFLPGHTGRLAELKTGQHVRAAYEPRERGAVAQWIELLTP